MRMDDDPSLHFLVAVRAGAGRPLRREMRRTAESFLKTTAAISATAARRKAAWEQDRGSVPSRSPLRAVQRYVRQPTGQMPPYTAKVVSDKDLADIYAFLQSVKQPAPVKEIPISWFFFRVLAPASLSNSRDQAVAAMMIPPVTCTTGSEMPKKLSSSEPRNSMTIRNRMVAMAILRANCR
jgi:hypothetical protein